MCVPECRVALHRAVGSEDDKFSGPLVPPGGISYHAGCSATFYRTTYRAAAIPGFSPGYRNANSGALNAVGNYGYSLSSSVSGTNGMWLEFRPTLVDPGFTNNRANGLQVRCLQAFIGILFI